MIEGLPYPFDVRVRAQVEALIHAGYDVTVVGPKGHGLEEREETINGVRVLRYTAPPGGRNILGYLREYGRSFLGLGRLVHRAARDRPVDLAFVCNPPDILVALALPLKRTGAALLFDYREISPELFEAKFGQQGMLSTALFSLLLWCERFAFRHADSTVTVSEPCAEIARTRGGLHPDRVFLVGNGPDPRRIYPVPPRPALRRGREHLVLWLGAMSQQEGLGRLIEAGDALVNRLGRRDTHIALVGPGDVHDVLRDDIRQRGLEDVIELRGAVEDDLVRAYISTADVCIGVDEANSMNDRAAMRKILEYMAMGRPVVQFPLAEMQRICGEATVYARNADPHDLAQQIGSLLDDPQRRERLGAAARRKVEGILWPRQVPSLLQAVEFAINGRAADRRTGNHGSARPEAPGQQEIPGVLSEARWVAPA